jgi:hypothetical protein
MSFGRKKLKREKCVRKKKNEESSNGIRKKSKINEKRVKKITSESEGE